MNLERQKRKSYKLYIINITNTIHTLYIYIYFVKSDIKYKFSFQMLSLDEYSPIIGKTPGSKMARLL